MFFFLNKFLFPSPPYIGLLNIPVILLSAHIRLSTLIIDSSWLGSIQVLRKKVDGRNIKPRAGKNLCLCTT